METKEIFAQRVVELRKEKGINQAQLAERVGVSKTSANLYESATRVPDIQVLARYAKELEVTSDYLLGLSDNRTQETAAIGDKLGLSDGAIKSLKRYVDYKNGIYTDFEKNFEKAPHKAEKIKKIISQKAKIMNEVINIVLNEPSLLEGIHNYIFSELNGYIKWDEIKECGDLDSTENDSMREDLRNVNNALNIYQIQKQLDAIQRRCWKESVIDYYFEIDIEDFAEENNVEEDQREE